VKRLAPARAIGAALRRLPLFAPETSTQLRTWQWLALIGGGLAFALPVREFGVSLCYFYNLTGLPCPGCGLTRSVHFALHLNPAHAFYYHPLGLLAAPAIAYFSVTAFWRPAARIFESFQAHSALLILSVGVAMLIFGAGRALIFAFGPPLSAADGGFAVVLAAERMQVGYFAPAWSALLAALWP
jgi:hypothetical protein